jgi:hypothetical protein
MRGFEHGGTLLIVPPELSDQLLNKNPFLSLMYKFSDGVARARFRMLILKLMNHLAESGAASSHSTLEMKRKSEAEERDRKSAERNPRDVVVVSVDANIAGEAQPTESLKEFMQVGWHEYAISQDKELTTLDEGVFEMAHLIAGLSNVDGAVVMTKRFELLGFAGEIACADYEVLQVARALDLEGEHIVMESAERVGTRHRSVYRFCNAFREAIAIVVSQDGGVRIVSWKDGRITYWNHQATTISLDF